MTAPTAAASSRAATSQPKLGARAVATVAMATPRLCARSQVRRGMRSAEGQRDHHPDQRRWRPHLTRYRLGDAELGGDGRQQRTEHGRVDDRRKRADREDGKRQHAA